MGPAAVTTALAVLAAAGGALAHVRPTGVPVADLLYPALLAAAVVVACARSPRWTWLVLSGTALGLSRGPVLVPCGLALAVAFVATLGSRRDPRWGAVVGALAAQSVLRWPAVGFHGLPSLMAAACLAPCLVGALVAKGPHRAATGVAVGGAALFALGVCTIPLILSALAARSAVSAGTAHAHAALGAFTASAPAGADTELRAAQVDFAHAHALLSGWWTAPARLVPVVAQQRRALVGAAGLAAQLSGGATGLADQAGAEQAMYRDGRLDLDALAREQVVVGRLGRLLAVTEQGLRSSDSGWLVPPVESRLGVIVGQVHQLDAQVTSAQQVLQILPDLLGGHGERRYFVAFTTPSESRGLGGFIGAFGELTANDGHLALTRSGVIGDLNDATPVASRHLSGPADYLARYGRFDPTAYLQDLTYSPDLPTVAQVISQLYPQAGGEHIDGVLVIDPAGLAALLALTGPVNAPGLPTLTSANAASVLLESQYQIYAGGEQQRTERHSALLEALQGTFAKLSAGSVTDIRRLSAALVPAVDQGRLMLWSADAGDEAVLARMDVDGSFPSAAGGDLLAVTTQNAGNNKLDAYLRRTIDDQVTFDPATGQVTATLTVTLHNTAPSSGLTPAVGASPAYPGAPSGTNETWLSLYTPLDPLSATIDGRATGLAPGRELGTDVYSVYLSIPPGGTERLVVTLSGTVTAGAYRLTVHPQPLVNPDHTTVEVTATPGWRPAAGEWTVGEDLRQVRTFSFAPSR